MGIFGMDTIDFSDTGPGYTDSTPADSSYTSVGGDFGPTSNPPKGPSNSPFVAGLNLLLSNPTAFWNTLTSDNADSVPNADIKRAATGSIADNAKAGPIPNPTKLPLWVELAIIGTIGVVGLVAIGFIIHEVK